MPGPKPAASGLDAPRDDSVSHRLALGIALVWCVLLGALTFSARWQQIEDRGFDELTVITAPKRSEFPITIVGVDEPSFNKLKLQWPWPRSVHAELIDRLAKAGAAVIVLDILFAEPSNKKDDQRLADAIRSAGNVVLVANRVYHETANTAQWIRVDPLPQLIDAGASAGLAQVPLDADLFVRRLPEFDDALWRVTLRRLRAVHPDLDINLTLAPDAMIRFAGPHGTFPYVSYHEVVQPDGSIPADYFKDQIVLVGFNVEAAADIGSAQSDLFSTPFTRSSAYLTPGVEIHAEAMETVLGGRAINPAPKVAELTLLALLGVACALLMRRWRPLLSALAGLGFVVAVLALDWALFAHAHTWLPVFASAAVIPAVYVSLGGYSFLREQARRRGVTQAFSLYVTPQVVNQLLAHPERMKLGGERRDVTFMFTDLASFTSFSEALPAERVVYLLNQHFTEMTDIILKYDGTVARFIGDAIMAFWGAPLDDEKQAEHAVRAAIEMQAAMVNQRERFAAEGLPRIQMRIGIQSGNAILGNLGSAKRFDYTAIADDVNLAARLEGTNKIYGTGIMIGDATARQLPADIPLRRVDRVIVKGKSQPVEVFTPCADPEVIRLSDEALLNFRAREWDASERLWQELLAHTPGDGIAALYLRRIAEYRDEAPGPGWDGAVALDKM
jgi:adenylate cyclase